MPWNKDKNIRDASHWLSRKIELIEIKDNQITNQIQHNILRGGIFNIELGEGNIGGEKNKKRPCLVISRNALNKGDTVLVIPLTTKFSYNIQHNKKAPKYNNHFILFKIDYPFLDDDSCIKCEDIRSIDKVRIRDHIGNIRHQHLKLVKNRVLFTLNF